MMKTTVVKDTGIVRADFLSVGDSNDSHRADDVCLHYHSVLAYTEREK